jgi:hypothetical protein
MQYPEDCCEYSTIYRLNTPHKSGSSLKRQEKWAIEAISIFHGDITITLLAGLQKYELT